MGAGLAGHLSTFQQAWKATVLPEVPCTYGRWAPLQLSTSKASDQSRSAEQCLSDMASCIPAVQEDPAAAIGILGQGELGQVFKHVALLDLFSLGPCQTVCRLWKSLAHSEELYQLAYETHIPAACHRVDLLDGELDTYMAVRQPVLLPEALTPAIFTDKPGAWKRLCMLSCQKVYKRPSQILTDTTSVGEVATSTQ